MKTVQFELSKYAIVNEESAVQHEPYARWAEWRAGDHTHTIWTLSTQSSVEAVYM